MNNILQLPSVTVYSEFEHFKRRDDVLKKGPRKFEKFYIYKNIQGAEQAIRQLKSWNVPELYRSTAGGRAEAPFRRRYWSDG